MFKYNIKYFLFSTIVFISKEVENNLSGVFLSTHVYSAIYSKFWHLI